MGRRTREKDKAALEAGGPPEAPVDESDRRITWEAAPLRFAPLILAAAGLYWAMSSFWGFVQDDAYISLRYAYFFAHGDGLVFNPGERVEGYTNLSWTVIAAFFIKLGLDPLDALRYLGMVSALVLLVLVWLEAGGARWATSRRACWTAGVAATLLASYTTLALWSIAGLEESFFTVLVFAGYREYALGRYPRAAYFWVAATFTRPEGLPAFALAFALRALAALVNRRSPDRDEIKAVIIYAAGLGSLLVFRLAYYGELAPNTFFVKGVANWASHKHGWTELGKFLQFNYIGISLALAFFGLLGHAMMPASPPPPAKGENLRRPLEETAYGALYLTGMIYYLVRVGGDLLPFYRLYMPLLPFIALWAGKCVEFLASLVLVREEALDTKPHVRRSAGVALALMVTVVVLWLATQGFETTRGHPEFRGTVIALDRCHGTAGRYLEAVAKQRGKRITVLAQDMGMTPWTAPSVRFVDVIGLTDYTVAHTLYSYAYTPYIRYIVWNEPGWQKKIQEMETKLRNYLASQKADFVLVNISCDGTQTDAYRAGLAKLDHSVFQVPVENNTFYYGYPATQEFKDNYRLSQGFEFSAVHFLLLYERTSAAAAVPSGPVVVSEPTGGPAPPPEGR